MHSWAGMRKDAQRGKEQCVQSPGPYGWTGVCAAGVQGRDRAAQAVRGAAVSISTATCTHTRVGGAQRRHWEMSRLPDKIQDGQLNSILDKKQQFLVNYDIFPLYFY